jgi:hypothetical protein
MTPTGITIADSSRDRNKNFLRRCNPKSFVPADQSLSQHKRPPLPKATLLPTCKPTLPQRRRPFYASFIIAHAAKEADDRHLEPAL